MRVYLYEPGSPGYIYAEIAVGESQWAETLELGMPRTAIGDVSAIASPTSEALLHDELLEVSTRRRALLAWEAGEDHALDEWSAADRAEAEAEDARMLALSDEELFAELRSSGIKAGIPLEVIEREIAAAREERRRMPRGDLSIVSDH